MQSGSSGNFKVGTIGGRYGVSWIPFSGAPTDGTSGTFAGKAAPGSTLIDYATGNRYSNIGTKASPVWSRDIQVAVVTLTNAEIKAIRATPKTLVAAPGAGKKIEFLGAALNVNATAGVYTESADNMAIRYVDGSGIIVSGAIEATGFVDQAGKMHSQAIPVVDAIATEAQAVNVPLVLHNTGDGEYGGGNAANSMRVVVTYRVVSTL